MEDSQLESSACLPVNPTGSIVARRIGEKKECMPTSHRALAAICLQRPLRVAFMTIGELAREAGTSIATVTRFARALDFEGYSDLRASLLREAEIAAGALPAAPGPSLSYPTDQSTAIHTLMQQLPGYGQLEALVDQIRSAAHISIIGLNAPHSLVDLLYETLIARRLGVYRLGPAQLSKHMTGDLPPPAADGLYIFLGPCGAPGDVQTLITLIQASRGTAAYLSAGRMDCPELPWDVYVAPGSAVPRDEGDAAFLLVMYMLLHCWQSKRIEAPPSVSATAQ